MKYTGFPALKIKPHRLRVSWFGSWYRTALSANKTSRKKSTKHRPGRMDRALQLAVPLAESETAAEFLAKQCSERAADAWFWIDWMSINWVISHKFQVGTWSRRLTVDMRVMVDFPDIRKVWLWSLQPFLHWGFVCDVCVFGCACEQFMSLRSSPFDKAQLPCQGSIQKQPGGQGNGCTTGGGWNYFWHPRWESELTEWWDGETAVTAFQAAYDRSKNFHKLGRVQGDQYQISFSVS